MNILMVASEATPFAKTGGLADVLGGLPPALAARGEQCRRCHSSLPAESLSAPSARGLSQSLDSAGPRLSSGCASRRRTQRYILFRQLPAFVRSQWNLRRRAGGFPDNYMRFAVLSMAAIGVARYLFRPDIIHTHDWQAALVPVYIREHFNTRS